MPDNGSTSNGESHLPRTRVQPERVRRVHAGSVERGPVVYWMSRDQRARGNDALLFAQDLARALDRPLAVCFCLVPTFLGACLRQYRFMLDGLRETEAVLASKGIPFWMRIGQPPDEIQQVVRAQSAAALVVDFDPLRIKQRWQRKAARGVGVPVYEVDAHNIVPCRVVSSKAEYAARTFRPKVQACLGRFLVPIGNLRAQETTRLRVRAVDWNAVMGALRVDRSVAPVTWLKPGRRAALRVLRGFVRERLAGYAEGARDPNADALSNLSPYLHFGQISARHVALAVRDAAVPRDAKEAFLEECIVRRELSDNFCLYTPDYDKVTCAPAWAERTLEAHRNDRRPERVARPVLEAATTRDPIWNAAQREMVQRGKMHGYMRMYWAKKILEWSPDAETALETVLYLNDRYELDGRDPNGYAGAAWSICGIHDRAWNERPVFGKIRYMSAAGCRRKFDCDAYIARQNR